MESNITATLITATLGGGGTVALIGLLKSLIDKWTGKADKQRIANRESLQDYRDEIKRLNEVIALAEKKVNGYAAQVDVERAARIKYQETVLRIRSIAINHGVPPQALYWDND